MLQHYSERVSPDATEKDGVADFRPANKSPSIPEDNEEDKTCSDETESAKLDLEGYEGQKRVDELDDKINLNDNQLNSDLLVAVADY